MSVNVALEPLVHTSVNEAVYRQLRDHLMRGDYAAGDILGIQELADAFGTSAMPVREALRRLAAQRAVEPMKSRSMQVPLMSNERLDDIKRTRILIEGTAAAWAVDHITPDELDLLRTLAAQLGDSLSCPASIDTGLEINQKFHFTIYRAAQSETMLAMIENLWLQSGPYLRATRALMHSTERPGIEFHAQIVRAIEQGDAQAARLAMEQDICWAFDKTKAHTITAMA